LSGRVEVEITGIAAGGAGVGRLPDGRAVFVHGTAPGERAAARIERARGRWATARLLAVLRAAPDRRPAPCPFYGRCGGCTLEHLEYGAQLAAKSRIVADAIHRIGGIDAALPPIEPSPHELRYRNRISFTLLRLSAGRIVAGFHPLDRPARVVDVTGACLLPEPAIAEAWDALRRGWGAGASRLPSGRALRLTLRSTAKGSVSLLVDGGYGAGRPDALIEAVPALGAVWQRHTPSAEPVLLAGAASLDEEWNGAPVRLEGGVFLQVNRDAAAILQAHVLARAGADLEGAKVVDAYCGIGIYSRALAERGARVVGIELDAAAVREAVRAAPRAVRFIAGRVEDALPHELPADLVIANPPRAGLDAAVCAALGGAPPRRILYISCDAATLARDLARLGDAFTLRSLHCFDLFPQTAHVESVAELVCATT